MQIIKWKIIFQWWNWQRTLKQYVFFFMVAWQQSLHTYVLKQAHDQGPFLSMVKPNKLTYLKSVNLQLPKPHSRMNKKYQVQGTKACKEAYGSILIFKSGHAFGVVNDSSII